MAAETLAQPTVAEKDTADIEKMTPHTPDNTSLEDTTIAALQRVKAADEHHPIHWGSFKKWFVVFWYCLLQVFVTLTTTSYVSAEFLVQEQYGGTTQVVALGQSLFIIGTAIGPVFLGPLSYVLDLYYFPSSRCFLCCATRTTPPCHKSLAVFLSFFPSFFLTSSLLCVSEEVLTTPAQRHWRSQMGLRCRHLRLCHPQHRLRQGPESAHAHHLPVPLRSRWQCGPVQRRRHYRRSVRRF